MKKLYLILLLLVLFNKPVSAQESIPVGLIATPLGDIYIEFHEQTPNHRNSFIQLAKDGYWDSLTFNRVIPDFVAQGGCPDTPEGFNDPDYLLKPEFSSELTHIYGAVGAGRDGNQDKLSARCQFYIVQNKEGLHRLDGDYTVFGQVIKGMDIVDRIVSVPKNELDTPNENIDLKISILYMNREEINKQKSLNSTSES